MFTVNDDVVMMDMISHASYFGVVTRVEGEGDAARFSINDPVRVLNIVVDANGYQVQVVTPTMFYFMVRPPTEAEANEILGLRMLAALDAQWAAFRNRPPTIEQVTQLNDAIQALNLE